MYLLDIRSKISLILAILSWIESTVDSVRCLKDDTVPDWYPINVYWCNDTLKSTCCNDEKQFTCCEPSGTVQLKDQIVTWAVIFGFIAFVVTVWCCYRKETHVCETDNIIGKCCSRCCPCCDCCCCCASRELETESRSSKTAFDGVTDQSYINATLWEEEEIKGYYGNRIAKWNGKVADSISYGADNKAFHYPFPTSDAVSAPGAGSGMAGKEMLAALRDREDVNLIDA